MKSKRPSTRKGRDMEKRRGQNRRASKRAYDKKKRLAEEAERAKRPPGRRYRRPEEAPEPEPPVSQSPEPAAPQVSQVPAPKVPSRPKKLTTWERRLAADRIRQERAVKRALKADADLLKRLFAMEDEVLGETENRFIRSGDGTPSAVIESDCRICGSKKSGRFTTNYCCSDCIGSMSFPYHNGGFDDREPNIRAMIAKVARLKATKLTVVCAECGEPVPDPEGLKREDQLCDECYRILVGERAVDRGMLRQIH